MSTSRTNSTPAKKADSSAKKSAVTETPKETISNICSLLEGLKTELKAAKKAPINDLGHRLNDAKKKAEDVEYATNTAPKKEIAKFSDKLSSYLKIIKDEITAAYKTPINMLHKVCDNMNNAIDKVELAEVLLEAKNAKKGGKE